LCKLSFLIIYFEKCLHLYKDYVGVNTTAKIPNTSKDTNFIIQYRQYDKETFIDGNNTVWIASAYKSVGRCKHFCANAVGYRQNTAVLVSTVVYLRPLVVK